MAFSQILALLPLVISATGLVPTVDARSVSDNAYRYSSGGSAFPIPADYTVPLAPASVAGAPAGLPPPPGISKYFPVVSVWVDCGFELNCGR
jgi:hypothetical protein